jgi:hypothetical protein
MKRLWIGILPLFLLFPETRNITGCTKNITARTNDGPYVFYNSDHVLAKYIVIEEGTKHVQTDSVSINDRSTLVLNVATDIDGKSFQVKLKDKLENEQSEYPAAGKQFVLSDIEGNFRAFRRLLQGNGVIDEQMNWTFGDGHLVLVGDFCDRGDHVTEVYWLIYSLEEKAKAAGGHVHLVLGNHEIMNMSGDLRYLHPKYQQTTVLLHHSYPALYGPQTELGRWLRTKNIVEKVGNVIYAHGGISLLVDAMDINTTGINDLSRPFYADSTYRYNNPRLDTLFSDMGPFWFRGYYKTEKALPEDVTETLKKFSVNHIVTGHTVVADTVSMWYNGKLFNTDTHHAQGHSEALLIDGKKFYRVNATGEKFEIWTQ